MAPADPNTPDEDLANAGEDFFSGLERPTCFEHDKFDIYTPTPREPRPAVVFVHGGPIPEGQTPTPRNWATFTGYGALAASADLVGVTFDHQLHTMDHYPVSAEDVSAVVNQARELPQVDPDRIVLWFFSGGGGLAADWLRRLPSWLRGIVWTYPILAPPPDWAGDGPRFDCTRAVTEAPELPKLLVRVSDEYPSFKETQDAVLQAARASHSTLDVTELPQASHGYETHGYEKSARQATDQAMSWVAAVMGRS